MRKLALFTSLLVFLRPFAMEAQETHHHPPATAREIGQIQFPISCNAEARDEFERGVAMLHSFWYQEAERAFARVTAVDPSCAMGYWGIAMSLYHPLWADVPDLERGQAAVAKAKALAGKTARERDYIAAIEAFYWNSETLDQRARAVAYAQAMEEVHSRYPDDREAAVLYALVLLATAPPTDKTYANQKTAAAILGQVHAVAPDHPGVTHYFIHAYDAPPLAAFGLAAARRYAQIAPAVPHALHMPSHIFTRLGLWEESIHSNLVSLAAAKDYAARTRMQGAWDEQLHAMDYLAYAYLQGAQDRVAKGVLEELHAIRSGEPENGKVAYAFAAIPARYAVERRRWSEAAALGVHPEDFPWDRFRWAGAITVFTRALGAARSGDAGAARRHVGELESVRDALVEARDVYAADQVEIQRRSASAWLARAEGRDAEAVELMRSAADLEDSTEKHPVTPGAIVPARELLGDLLLELGDTEGAWREYEKALASSPNRFTGLYGAARTAELSGDLERAGQLYARLVAACDRADSDRVELARAKAFLARR